MPQQLVTINAKNHHLQVRITRPVEFKDKVCTQKLMHPIILPAVNSVPNVVWCACPSRFSCPWLPSTLFCCLLIHFSTLSTWRIHGKSNGRKLAYSLHRLRSFSNCKAAENFLRTRVASLFSVSFFPLSFSFMLAPPFQCSSIFLVYIGLNW